MDIRSVAHALHTTGGNDRAVTELDALGGEHDGLHAASADLVDGGRIGAGGDARGDGDLAGRRLTNTGLDDVAEVDLLNKGGVDLACPERMLKGDCAELWRGEGLEGAVEGGDRGARGGDDDDFVRLQTGQQKSSSDRTRLTMNRTSLGEDACLERRARSMVIL